MTGQQLLEALGKGEAVDWEFKSAKGGLPGSLWETYSALANTDGGVIVLGVDQKGDHFEVGGLPNPAKMKTDFWNLVNNRGKVSVNLLADGDVQAVPVEGKDVLVIIVPRADRRQRPVFVGNNPLTGTYRRNYEGDYLCKQEDVGRMLADRSEEPADSVILDGFGLEDLDRPTLEQYRNRFSARASAHPWLSLDDQGLLEKLGGWRRERAGNKEGLTVAGLLMFGKDEAIGAPEAIPHYHVDYRECLSDDPGVRWTDRLTIDGRWVANLFQFYVRTLLRLTTDLKVPFRMSTGLQRTDDTPVHEALREALSNALIHADYRGAGGIVIEKNKDRFEMSNPGTLLVSLDQLLRGGVSECRNKALQTMFQMVGFGEKAGSGWDKIRQGWASQHWRTPDIEETNGPDRVRLVLPMISLLPEASLEKLRQQFGAAFDQLPPLARQALVTADVEGNVSNSRMRLVCNEHPADLTRLLQTLCTQGFLEQHGQKRGAYYTLPPAPSPANEVSSPANEVSSPANEVSSPANEVSSPAESPQPIQNDPVLLAIARQARENRKLPEETTRRIIGELCNGRYLTADQIAQLLDREAKYTRSRFLTPLTQSGQLLLRYPNEPTHPNQAYTSNRP